MKGAIENFGRSSDYTGRQFAWRRHLYRCTRQSDHPTHLVLCAHRRNADHRADASGLEAQHLLQDGGTITDHRPYSVAPEPDYVRKFRSGLGHTRMAALPAQHADASRVCHGPYYDFVHLVRLRLCPHEVPRQRSADALQYQSDVDPGLGDARAPFRDDSVHGLGRDMDASNHPLPSSPQPAHDLRAAPFLPRLPQRPVRRGPH